jgi:hypothetical protein
LPTNHKYKKNINEFFIGRFERGIAPPLPLSEELYDIVSQYDDIVFSFQSDKFKFLGFGVTHNFIRQSTLLELPY